MEQLLIAGAAALRKAALNEDAKAYVLNNEVLYRFMKKAAERYIGGENLTETVEKVRISTNEGFKCSIWGKVRDLLRKRIKPQMNF